MRLSLADARALAEAAFVRLGHDAEESRIAADHLIDCELRGLGYAGFGRLVSIGERIRRAGRGMRPIAVVKETPVSALIDGGDNLGLIVAQRATEAVIGKAQACGIAAVAANHTWYTGTLSYYAEQPAARDLVCMIASNATPRVAPHGGVEARMGSNPICFGFPSAEAPVVWDIGTSAVGHAQVMLARRLGRPLPDGAAFDRDGRPTTDPAEAIAGAFAAWGGARGSGLGIVVQLLGMLAGTPVLPGELTDFGFVIVALKPDLFIPDADYKACVAEYSKVIRATRPVAGGEPIRMPFDRSRAERQRRMAEGVIEIPDKIHAAVAAVASGGAG